MRGIRHHVLHFLRRRYSPTVVELPVMLALIVTACVEVIPTLTPRAN
jgi:hypothetical protein